MTTSSFSDPFNSSKKEDSSKCGYVVSYNGKDEPKYQMNNPAYMREVSRSFSDNIPEVVLNKRPFQAQSLIFATQPSVLAGEESLCNVHTDIFYQSQVTRSFL